MNRTRFGKLTTTQLYEKAAMLLRRHDQEQHPVTRLGWHQLLIEVTNEIVLREIEGMGKVLELRAA